MKNAIILFLIVLFCITGVSISTVHAINMNGTSYKIQFGNVNIGGNNETSTSYKLGTTIGQDAAGKFSSTGYIVKAGFQYIHSIIPFSFSISNTNMNLGTLLPGTPNTANTNLKVSFGAAGDYQVTAIEETAFKTLAGNTIASTVCDSGPCTTTTAQPWTSSSTYGFGYNVSCSNVPTSPLSIPCSTDIPADFIGTTYFRPFPNRSLGNSPSVVMSSTNVTAYSPTFAGPTPAILEPNRNTHQTTITFKANVAGTQAAGTYQTIINFVATPSY